MVVKGRGGSIPSPSAQVLKKTTDNKKMDIIAVSDLHGYLPDLDNYYCDVLIIAGDVCPIHNHEIDFQEDWLKTEFSLWLSGLPIRYVIGVGGNHDFVLQEKSELGQTLPWVYLNNYHVDIEGVRFWGTPTCTFIDGYWAFERTENQLVDVYETIPDDVDVMISHGPAFGVGDFSFMGYVNTGSRTLREKIWTINQIISSVVIFMKEME